MALRERTFYSQEATRARKVGLFWRRWSTSCKIHAVNPNAYIADILAKLVNNWPNGRLGELTPWAWKAANNTS